MSMINPPYLNPKTLHNHINANKFNLVLLKQTPITTHTYTHTHSNRSEKSNQNPDKLLHLTPHKSNIQIPKTLKKKNHTQTTRAATMKFNPKKKKKKIRH